MHNDLTWADWNRLRVSSYFYIVQPWAVFLVCNLCFEFLKLILLIIMHINKGIMWGCKLCLFFYVVNSAPKFLHFSFKVLHTFHQYLLCREKKKLSFSQAGSTPSIFGPSPLVLQYFRKRLGVLMKSRVASFFFLRSPLIVRSHLVKLPLAVW